MNNNPVKNHALSPNVRGARLPDLSGPLFSHLGHFAHPEIVEGVLKAGAEIVRARAAKKMLAVKTAVGLI